jgi:microcystin-dependent protein
MNSPYLGQIFMFGFDFAAKGYSLCSGQQMSIQQNQALFSIFGTFYGGNGVQTFGLPDLRGRTYLSQGQGPGTSNYTMGEQVGAQQTTLLTANLAMHNHMFNVSNALASTGTPGSTTALSQGPIVGTTTVPMYATTSPSAQMIVTELTNSGNNQPVPVLQPYLCINFSVALSGLFPSRN